MENQLLIETAAIIAIIILFIKFNNFKRFNNIKSEVKSGNNNFNKTENYSANSKISLDNYPDKLADRKIFAKKIRTSNISTSYYKSKNILTIENDIQSENSITAKIHINTASLISLVLFDIFGNCKNKIVNDFYVTGIYQIQIDTSKINLGTYFLEFNSNNSKETVIISIYDNSK